MLDCIITFEFKDLLTYGYWKCFKKWNTFVMLIYVNTDKWHKIWLLQNHLLYFSKTTESQHSLSLRLIYSSLSPTISLLLHSIISDKLSIIPSSLHIFWPSISTFYLFLDLFFDE